MTENQPSQHSASEPDRPTDTERIDDRRKRSSVKRAVQAEEETLHSQQVKQIGSQSDADSQRVGDQIGDNIASPPEEA
jgi:hypothetical protein